MKKKPIIKTLGRAPRHLTGKHQIDWTYMMKKFPTHREVIKAHKNNQEFLAQLKQKLERVG